MNHRATNATPHTWGLKAGFIRRGCVAWAFMPVGEGIVIPAQAGIQKGEPEAVV